MHQFNFNLEDARQQAVAFIHKIGIEPYDDSDLLFNGELHRFRTREDKPHETSGAVRIHMDSWPAGYVQDWRKGIKENWKYDVSGLSDEQRTYFNSDEFKKKCEEQERKARRAREAKQREATANAQRFWESSNEAEYDHPYLCRKQVYPYSLHVNPHTGDLCVPLCDIDDRLQSIQFIPADKDKHKIFWPGAPLEGAFFSIALDTLKDEPTQTILLGEGYATMAKVYELTSLPCVAAMSCGNLRSVASALRKAYPESKIIITADNDWETEKTHGYNPGLREARHVVNLGLAVNIIVPEFSEQDSGLTDWDDFALKFGDENTAWILQQKIHLALMPQEVRSLLPRIEAVNAQELRHKIFQPVVWAVPGFLPAGLTVLGGGPKVGKSILSLHIGLGIAIGGCVFGKINVEQGSVLYLALEDTERRIKERINQSDLPEDCDISKLFLVTQIPRQNDGGILYIRWWLSQHPDAKLVIVDTLQKFRKLSTGKLNVYAEDYETLSELKKVADEFNVSFLVIHHLKKISRRQAMEEDWINHLSGSAGITGCADTILYLNRERSGTRGTLRRTGRDVEEKDFNVTLDGYGWVLEESEEVVTIPEWQRQITDYLNEHETVTPMQLAQEFNLEVRTAQKNLDRARKAGLLDKIGRGQFTLRK